MLAAASPSDLLFGMEWKRWSKPDYVQTGSIQAVDGPISMSKENASFLPST